MTSEPVETHLPCDHCGSSDASSTYDDGHKYCHSCGRYTKGDYDMEDTTPTTTKSLKVGEYKSIPERGLTLDTCKKFGVTQMEGIHLYPYANQEGKHSFNKIRYVSDKEFSSEGSSKENQLFGQTKFPNGGRYLTIVEGELDALSAYQMLGSKYPVVSVPNAQGALKACKTNFKWINSFENIILSFDADEPGQKASDQVAELFGRKSKVQKMDKHLKDASKYLTDGKSKEWVDLWWRAETWTPECIKAGVDLHDIVFKDVNVESVNYPWDGLNKLTYGMRLGEMTTLTAGSGMGKTQLLREIKHYILKSSSYNIGCLFMEETVRDSGLGVMSIDASIPFHLPDAEYTEQEKQQAFNNTLGTNRLFYYDSFGSNDIDTITSYIRYMVNACDCKFIILDHISILVSDQRNGDERKALDELATKLKTLTIELNICLLMVSHAKRQTSKPLEEGGHTSLSDLRGTAAIGQLSNIVLGLERDGQSPDPRIANTTMVRVLKNRFTGRTGIGSMLYYDSETGRMSEVKENEEHVTDGSS